MTERKCVPGAKAESGDAEEGCRRSIFGATTINGFLYGVTTWN